MSDVRLIERWLPIAELGIESTRERTPMTPFPAPNRLHVWWARRPLVASRAAILASLLPADADRQKFLHVLGIHGDPVATRKPRSMTLADGMNVLRDGPYSYPRAFSYVPAQADRKWMATSFGGSDHHGFLIRPPAEEVFRSKLFDLVLESLRNDLNPVSELIMHATVELAVELRRRIEVGIRGSLEVLRSGEGRAAGMAIPRGTVSQSRYRPTTSGHARLFAPIATGWCRCRRTGGWRRMGRG